jgi:glycerol-3-phosphate dehydrogenase (NAD(P)+)
VLGAGAWGTTLANLLAENGTPVTLWCHDPALAAKLARERTNQRYLPGFQLHELVRPTNEVEEAVAGKSLVVGVVPSQFTREVVATATPHLQPGAIVVSASKGIETGSLLRMSEIYAELLPEAFRGRVGVLSGPSFAREVSERRPTALTLAAPSEATAIVAREFFVCQHLRVYTSSDVVGVELGGAIKNVIAIAAGVAEGLGAGHNGRAALITRGMAEIFRLGQALGAQPLTLSGLSGAGDLILTCTSRSSRNYSVGVRLGGGEALDRILADMTAVAEGVKTASSAYDLARREGVDMPIVSEIYNILYKDKSPAAALVDLMSRESKAEF